MDRTPRVRKFIVGCLEKLGLLASERYSPPEAVQVYSVILPTFGVLMQEENSITMKAVLVAFHNLYCPLLRALCVPAVSWSPPLHSLHNMMSALMARAMERVASNHDGVRSIALKFMETVIVCNSSHQAALTGAAGSAEEHRHGFSLSDVPPDHPVLNPAAMQREADEVLARFTAIALSGRLSESNFHVVVFALGSLVHQRPQFLPQAIIPLEQLAAYQRLPRSQLKRVQNTLRVVLMNLLRYTKAEPFWDRVENALDTMGFGTQALLLRRELEKKSGYCFIFFFHLHLCGTHVYFVRFCISSFFATVV